MSDKSHPPARVFSPNSRFNTLARRPGGIPRGEAVDTAQARIEEIKPEFNAWLDNELIELGKAVERLKSGDAAAVERAQFHCKQLRDVGTTMGYELVSHVANTLSTILDKIRAGGDLNIDSIVCHMDALSLVRQNTYRRLRPDQVPELLEGLQRVAESVSIIPAGEPE
jgi:hypothetical protein